MTKTLLNLYNTTNPSLTMLDLDITQNIHDDIRQPFNTVIL